MKFEEAKELYSAGNPGPSSPRFKAWVAAENFLDGYASRDPEVEKLKTAHRIFEDRACLAEAKCGRFERDKEELADRFDNDMRRKQEEVSRLNHLCEDRINELSAEREASRRLVEAARKVKAWSDTMTAPAFTWAVEDLIEALKFYATPGHSPEGKTLREPGL